MTTLLVAAAQRGRGSGDDLEKIGVLAVGARTTVRFRVNRQPAAGGG